MSLFSPPRGPRLSTYLFARKQYEVVAAVVVAQLMGGTEQYVYRGGLLPGETSFAQIEMFLQKGLIREVGWS